MVFRQGLIRVKGEKGGNTPKDPLNVLRVSLELICADAFKDLL